MSRPRVSVIIPVYNVEAYSERCARALFEQTLDDIELIFVDDCSPDHSVDVIRNVLEDYPHRREQTMILRHSTNKGVAAARTTGMKAMTGEYMAHCDPDDMPTAEMYARMYAAARDNDADIVSCMYEENPGDGSAHGTIFTGSGLEALQTGGYTYGLWDKIIRASIIKDNEIYPYAGINYNEDLNVIVRALCHTRKVLGLEDALYIHSVGRAGSICSGNYKALLTNHSVPCMKLLDEFLEEYGHSCGDRRYSSRLTDRIKFWMKNALFTKADIDMWRSLWPESRRAIRHIKSLSVKERAMMTIVAYLFQ